MSVRDDVHDLVDALPEGELDAARRYLEVLRTSPHDSLARFLAAALEDDESSTSEQDHAAAQAPHAVRRGEWVSAAEVKRTPRA